MPTLSQITLTPAEAAALKTMAKDLEIRAKELPGETVDEDVDFMIHVQGKVSKTKDTFKSQPSPPSTEAMVGWFLSQLTAESRLRFVDAFMVHIQSRQEVLAKQAAEPVAVDADGKKKKVSILEEPDGEIGVLAGSMVKMATRDGRIPVNGSIKGLVTLSAVDFSKLKPAIRKQLSEVARVITFED